MGLFSSSKSSSKSTSQAWDNRSAAEGWRSLAAGGNAGAITYYNPGDKVFNRNAGVTIKQAVVAVAVLLVLWKIPAIRRGAMKLIRKG